MTPFWEGIKKDSSLVAMLFIACFRLVTGKKLQKWIGGTSPPKLVHPCETIKGGSKGIHLTPFGLWGPIVNILRGHS